MGGGREWKSKRIYIYFLFLFLTLMVFEWTSVGGLGYATQGSKVKSPITSSFASKKSPLSIVTNALLFIHLCTGNSCSLYIILLRLGNYLNRSFLPSSWTPFTCISGYEIELNVIINAQSTVFANAVTYLFGKEYSVRKSTAAISILEGSDDEQGESHRDRSVSPVEINMNWMSPDLIDCVKCSTTSYQWVSFWNCNTDRCLRVTERVKSHSFPTLFCLETLLKRKTWDRLFRTVATTTVILCGFRQPSGR